MTMEQLLNFLKSIKEVRVRKNISLEEISKRTRINLKFLEKLDEGQLEFLPQPYIRAFTKAYARIVGIGEKEIEEKLTPVNLPPEPVKIESSVDENSKKPEPVVKIEVAETTLENSLRRFKSYAWVLVMVPIIGGLIYLGSRFPRQHQRFEVSQPAVNTVKEESTKTLQTPVTPEKQILTLKAVAHERTWLSISIDNQETREYNLQKADEITWNALTAFQMRIGKSRGISLFLNGKDLGPLGSETSLVWNIIIDKNGIVSKELRSRPDVITPSSQGTTRKSDTLR